MPPETAPPRESRAASDRCPGPRRRWERRRNRGRVRRSPRRAGSAGSCLVGAQSAEGTVEWRDASRRRRTESLHDRVPVRLRTVEVPSRARAREPVRIRSAPSVALRVLAEPASRARPLSLFAVGPSAAARPRSTRRCPWPPRVALSSAWLNSGCAFSKAAIADSTSAWPYSSSKRSGPPSTFWGTRTDAVKSSSAKFGSA